MSEKQYNPIEIAKICQSYIRKKYTLKTSCVESSYLFDRVAFHLGLPCKRVVAQAQAFTPKLAQKVAEGVEPSILNTLKAEDGYWSVIVGNPSQQGDYVGRIQAELNRFVGHIICILGDGEEFALINPSADQMNRPEKNLIIDEPIYSFPCQNYEWIVIENKNGVIVRYKLHYEVKPLMPKTNKILDRAAIGIVKELNR